MTMTLAEFYEQIEVGLSAFAPCGTCGEQRICEQCQRDIEARPRVEPREQLEMFERGYPRQAISAHG